MTEEELMAKRCPHFADKGGLARYCLGAACSQYREKENARKNTATSNAREEKLDDTVWRFQFTSAGVNRYTRIRPIMDAWCGLAGVPPNVKT